MVTWGQFAAAEPELASFGAERLLIPPAYLASPRAQLPVLVLLSGQPGTPRDWLDGGRWRPARSSQARSNPEPWSACFSRL